MAHARHILVIACLALGAAAQAQENAPTVPDDYQSGDFGRVFHVEGGVTLLRAPGQEQPPARDQGSLNAPVFPGDTAITEREQRAEIQLAGGTLVRLAGETELVLQALPDPYAEYSDSPLLQLTRGTVQISAQLRDTEEFRIDTPDASIYLLGSGDFRIDVLEGRTFVQSRGGVAEVVGDGGSVLVRGGTRSTVLAGSLPEDPTPFNTLHNDPFDRWIASRVDEETFRENYAYEQDVEPYDELPSEVRPYYNELSRHGRWIHVDGYGYAWYPFDVEQGWRPYYDGYWSYGSRGYFWVSNEPWGWAPYHYGRWQWMTGYGWCWLPGRVFGGAWVSWSWGSAYVGWCPLGYWNYPAYVGTVYYGYYDPYAWTFVGYGHFSYRYGHHGYRHGHHKRHYYGYDDVRDTVGRTAVVTRPPRVPPETLANDPEARERVARRTRNNTRDHAPRIADPADRRRTRTFADDEQAIVKRGRARAAGRPVFAEESGAVERAAIRGRSRVPATTAAGSPTTRAPKPVRTVGAASRPTPRRTVERRAGTGDARATTAQSPASGRGSRGTTSPRATDSRVRELYRRSAEPRRTQPPQPRSTSASPRGSSGGRSASPARPSTRSSGSRSGSSKAAPSRSSGSRSGSSKAAPSRSSGSRSGSSKAAPSRSSGSRSGSSKAAPSRSSGSSKQKSGGSRSGGKSKGGR